MSINKNKVIVVHNTMKYSIEIIIKKKLLILPMTIIKTVPSEGKQAEKLCML